MDGNETRKRIDTINNKIKELINRFVLTGEINDLLKEKAAIQMTCNHAFENGKCIYCDQSEGENK